MIVILTKLHQIIFPMYKGIVCSNKIYCKSYSKTHTLDIIIKELVQGDNYLILYQSNSIVSHLYGPQEQ